MTLRVVVLISGRGSNLAALLAASVAPDAGFRVLAAIADREAAGLQLAREHKAAALRVDRTAYADREAFEAALSTQLAELAPDLIVLAGFMRVLSAQFVHQHAGRMLNIHPSLLPRYPGLHTHQRVLDAGDSEHGASVHLVIPQLDAGPVLAQAHIDVQPGDRAEDLAHRLLPREHALLVACVRAIAHGWVQVQSDRFSIGGHELTQALRLDASGQLVAAAAHPLAQH
jgi:phosphoribosylglycinamide formyltransferase-1